MKKQYVFISILFTIILLSMPSFSSDDSTYKKQRRQMIKEIEAKTILNRSKHPSGWFGVVYGMNIYRGCQHDCIYCDSRSECYQIEKFDDIIVKINENNC